MKRFALSVAAFLLALMAAEAALRPWPVQLRSEWLFASKESVMDADTIFLKAYQRDPHMYARDPGRPSVIALGDSFTAAYPVADDAAYPLHLAARLAAAGVPADVVNVGVGDSGPDQHLRIFERYVLPHARPDVVVWQLYANDVWDNWAKAVYDVRDGELVPLDARRNWLFVRQQVFRLTPLPAALKRNSRLYQHVMKVAERWRHAQVPPGYAGGPDAWAFDKLALEVEAMERLARERGFRAYFALVTPQLVYLDDSGEPWKEASHVARLRELHRRMHELLAERPGFIAIHLTAPSGEPAARALFCGGDRDHNALGDRHFNELGYERMAQAIADRLLADRAFENDVGNAAKAPGAAAASSAGR